MSLLLAGIILLLFIWIFGEIADRFSDRGDGSDAARHHRANQRYKTQS